MNIAKLYKWLSDPAQLSQTLAPKYQALKLLGDNIIIPVWPLNKMKLKCEY